MKQPLELSIQVPVLPCVLSPERCSSFSAPPSPRYAHLSTHTPFGPGVCSYREGCITGAGHLVIETIVEGYENPENSFSLYLPIWIKSLFLKNCAAYNASSPHVLD